MAQGPRRGHTMHNRMRNMHICKRTTSKMSHYSTIILVVRPRWGRSHVDALTPQVKTCGYAHATPLGSYSVASLCHLQYYSQRF